jgi:class 3 adenylate cyclase
VDSGGLKLGGEERTVTVLFADVRNFTGISEKMQPSELVSVLNRYLSVIIRSVLRHEGMVNKFGGDSIMAIWNVPVDCKGHALMAAKAAFSAQQDLLDFQGKTPNLPRMEFGIGVNTGTVVAGNMGSVDRLEYSVIGDAVNTASRLAGITPGRRVWIGSETYEMIKDFVEAVPMEPVSLKGKSATFQTYEVKDIRKPVIKYRLELSAELLKGKV